MTATADTRETAGGIVDEDERRVLRLRHELPAVAQSGYFNAGTNGPLPRAAHETMLAAATKELNAGRIVPGVYEAGWERNAVVRKTLAEIVGANPSELALTHSTSEGLSTALMGMDWAPGDEVITTQLEHPGLTVPLALLAHRFGVRIRMADIGYGDGDVIGPINTLISARTRAITISHVAWSSGAILPIKELAALARENGALLIVDGAQAAGQISLDMHDLGVDAYAIPGQKWLCGPEATGAVFIREDRLADIAPTYLRYAQVDLSGYLLPRGKSERFEIGEFYGPAIRAFGASLEFLRDEVGLDWAYGRIRRLGQRGHALLSDIPGVDVITPKDRMAGLINFTVAGMEPDAVAAAAYERGYTIRYVTYPPGPFTARVSCGWWNTEEEITGLADVLADLAKEHA